MRVGSPEELFKKASEVETPEIVLETVNFQAFFQWMMMQAKEHAPDNYSFSVKAARGQVSGEIIYTAPVIRYSRGGQPSKPKPLNLLGAQEVVAEYPDLLKQPEETDHFWFISPEKDMGDNYQDIKTKLLANGFVYERWQKDTPYTKGWRGKKV